MACEHLPSPFGGGTSSDVPPFGEDGARVLMSTPPRPSAGVEVPLGAYPVRRLVEVTAHMCAGLCDGGALCSAPYLAPRSAVGVCFVFAVGVVLWPSRRGVFFRKLAARPAGLGLL